MTDNSIPDSSGSEPPPLSVAWTHSAFFRVHAPRLESLIRRRLSPRFQARFDAADIVQSAFRSFFFRSADEHSSTTDFDPWPLLVQIAVRKLSQQVRRHSARRRSVNEERSTVVESASHAAGPESAAGLLEIVEQTSQQLTAKSRAAFELRLEGYEVLEIADRLEVSERTVRRYLDSARQVLNRLLELAPPPVQSNPDVSPLSPLPTSLKFQDFVLEQWVGDGAVGNVYRSTEKATGKTVAIKFVKKAFRFHPAAMGSFEREVEIVSQLQHPGILRLIGMGKTPNQGAFLVMEWAAQGDLCRHAATHSLSLADIRRGILQLADALDHAHRQGVIHCDLKPSNVLIGPEGRWLVCDFGLARQSTGWSGDGATNGGTPAFIAPELIEPTWGPIGPWTDVFGLGAILFNLLTGRSVHEGQSLSAIMANIVSSGSIVWPSEARREIPADWKAGCDLLLAKPVTERLPDMSAVKRVIEQWNC